VKTANLTWRRSTRCSTGACVEVTFIRASACASSSCVEVGCDANLVHVRDSKDPDGPVITYTADEWREHVVDEIKGGGWLPEYTYRTGDGEVVVRRNPIDRGLTFTEDEWDAFVEGVRAGEFDYARPAVTQ